MKREKVVNESLGEAFAAQQERCRELLRQYEACGPGGQFGAAFIRASLKEAEEAAMSGDLVAMIRAYTAMRGHE